MNFGLFHIAIIALVLLIIFSPSIIAVRRDHPKKKLIVLINILLAGTGIGWIALLIWVLDSDHL